MSLTETAVCVAMKDAAEVLLSNPVQGDTLEAEIQVDAEGRVLSIGQWNPVKDGFPFDSLLEAEPVRGGVWLMPC